MLRFAVVIALSVAGCASPQRWYITETGEKRAAPVPTERAAPQDEPVEETRPTKSRRASACARCQRDRMFCTQGQGFDDSGRAIAGLPPAPRRPCPDCSYACAYEED